MSLLDDLKKQAKEKANVEQGKGDTISQKHEESWRILAPKLQFIFDYMKELAENLNIVSSEGHSDYKLTKTIVFKKLKKQNFRLVKDKDRDFKDSDMKSFNFRYDLVGERNIPVIVSNMVEAEKIKGIMTQRMIKFTDKVENKNRIIISVVPKISVKFAYTVDFGNSLILLKISNFDAAWDQTIRLSSDLITNNLMEETAKYILLQPNKLMEMTGNIVSDDMREKFREKLRKDGKIKSDSEKEDKLENTAHRVLGMFKK